MQPFRIMEKREHGAVIDALSMSEALSISQLLQGGQGYLSLFLPSRWDIAAHSS